MKIKIPVILSRFIVVSSLLLGSLAHSMGLQVSPIYIGFNPDQTAESLWLINSLPEDPTAEPMRAQVRIYRWTQENNQDVLSPTDALVVSPPAAQIVNGSKQLVRVLRLSTTGIEPEESYRIIANELPVTAKEGDTGVKFVTEHSLPVFVNNIPLTELSPKLTFSIKTEGGKTLIHVRNDGNQHAQLADVNFTGSDGQVHPVRVGMLGYVLPGRDMEWPVDVSSDIFKTGGNFTYRFNGKTQGSAPLAQ